MSELRGKMKINIDLLNIKESIGYALRRKR
jgi:hypothetical protein